MNILVTGNKGYIGSILTQILIERSYSVRGFDTNYYEGIEKNKAESEINQTFKDIRDVSKDDLKNIDSVIHLAALSNDPLGEFNPKLTYNINFNAIIKLTKFSNQVGIKRFIYASSQNMYGISKINNELDEDNS